MIVKIQAHHLRKKKKLKTTNPLLIRPPKRLVIKPLKMLRTQPRHHKVMLSQKETEQQIKKTEQPLKRKMEQPNQMPRKTEQRKMPKQLEVLVYQMRFLEQELHQHQHEQAIKCSL